MSVYHQESSFDLTDPRKVPQGLPGLRRPYFENCWFSLRPDINDRKKKKKSTQKEP